MSIYNGKFIYERENNQLLNQIKYVVNSNLNSDYPYYYCSIANSTYNNFSCCFYDEFKFYGNYFKGTTNNFYIDVFKRLNDGVVQYDFRTNYSSCANSKSYELPTQDLVFTNVANNKTGLIDIAYEYKLAQSSGSSASSSNDVVSNNTWLFFISAILVLIVIRDFIHYCFRKR